MKKENKTLDWIIGLSPTLLFGAGAASDYLFKTSFSKYFDSLNISIVLGCAQGAMLGIIPPVKRFGDRIENVIRRAAYEAALGVERERYAPSKQKDSQ